MTEPLIRTVHEIVLDNIYLSLLDAYERLPNGKSNIKACLNYLEGDHGYEPPRGYIESNDEET